MYSFDFISAVKFTVVVKIQSFFLVFFLICHICCFVFVLAKTHLYSLFLFFCPSDMTRTVEISGEGGPLGIHVVPFFSSLSGR